MLNVGCWMLVVCTAPGIIEFVSNAFYEARPSSSNKSKYTLEKQVEKLSISVLGSLFKK